MIAWWTEAGPQARRAFVAASLGWMLDSFDVMLYAIVLPELIRDPGLHLSLDAAGILGSLTLLSAAAGGIVFGVVADRIGRTRALIAAILIYAVFTAACGFARPAVQLAVFRVLLAPFLVGSLAAARGFGAAFALTGVAFLCAAVMWIWIPAVTPSSNCG